MYLYIELWKAKDAWIQLTTEQRQAKIDQLLELAREHPIQGVIPFSFREIGDVRLFDGVTEQPIVIDPAVARPTGFHYAEAWMVPTRELIKTFEDRVESLGWWFEYFEQKNAWGLMDREATVADMINADISSQHPGQPSQDGRQLQNTDASPQLGRIGRTERDIRTLLQGVGDIKKDMDVVIDYVKGKK
jgi:hypothetical protein